MRSPLLVIAIIAILLVVPYPTAGFENTNTINFPHTAPPLTGSLSPQNSQNLNSEITQAVRDVTGENDWNAVLVVKPEVTYNLEVTLNTPYTATLFIAETAMPMSGTSGQLSIQPEEMSLDFNSQVSISLDVQMSVQKGILPPIASNGVIGPVILTYNANVPLNQISPLGTIRIPISDLIKEGAGALTPSLGLTLGLGAGVSVVVIPELDLDLILTAQIRAEHSQVGSFSVDPSSLLLSSIAPSSFSVNPTSPGNGILNWKFDQNIDVGIDIVPKLKFTISGNAGGGATYESPSLRLIPPSQPLPLLSYSKQASTSLSTPLSVLTPTMDISLLGIDPSIENSKVTIGVFDQKQASISGATLVLKAGQTVVAVSEQGSGTYVATIPTNLLSSGQLVVTASKANYVDASRTFAISTSFLDTYNNLKDEKDVIQSENVAIKEDNTRLEAEALELSSQLREAESNILKLQDELRNIASQTEPVTPTPVTQPPVSTALVPTTPVEPTPVTPPPVSTDTDKQPPVLAAPVSTTPVAETVNVAVEQDNTILLALGGIVGLALAGAGLFLKMKSKSSKGAAGGSAQPRQASRRDTCRKCGKAVQPDDSTCRNCGTRQR